MHFKYKLIFLSAIIPCVLNARILCVYPMPSLSHQSVFRAVTDELALKGHDIVVFTPNPTKENRTNVIEIDTSESYKTYMDFAKSITTTQRGIVMRVEDVDPKENKRMMNIITDIIEKEEFKEILNDKSQKFDLVIGESWFLLPSVLGKIFDAPVILLSSLYALPENYQSLGTLFNHPVIFPSLFRSKFETKSVIDKISVIYEEIKLRVLGREMINAEKEILKNSVYFKNVDLEEAERNIDLLFVNSNTMFEYNKPVPPNVINLGALHLKTVKSLPQDLQTYLNNSHHGVVYVSLGTNVVASLMDPELLQAFLKAFETLPYNVLWKMDGINLDSLPKNVRAQKWFPQRDLLHHPNIKAFVTQGGLQSTDEAIDAEVPLVGLPCLGDQWYNTEQYGRLGIGVRLDMLTLTADGLVNAVKQVIEDRRYKDNIKKLNTIIKDQPQTPLERAIWWIEYVIRHNGAKHLRTASASYTWFEYLLLDVVLFVFSVISVSVVSAVLIVRFLVRRMFRNPLMKIKRN